MSRPCCSICIPTYRRPQSLRRCLESIGRLKASDIDVSVYVGDNDPVKHEGLDTCEAMRSAFRFPLIAFVVDQRGIAPNRNALVARCLIDPATDFIAMIDDDEWADPNWLTDLLDAQAQADFDIVGGPVRRHFAQPVPTYIANANQYDWDARRTGSIEFIDATSNILFRSDVFREGFAPWFDNAFALMGCEDKDILLRLKLEGRSFGWAKNAYVTEEMPMSRSTFRWMVSRAYRVGNTDTIINLKHRPPGFGLGKECVKIAGALLLSIAKTSVFWRPDLRFEGLRLGARVAGKISALFGSRHEEYRVIHGS